MKANCVKTIKLLLILCVVLITGCGKEETSSAPVQEPIEKESSVETNSDSKESTQTSELTFQFGEKAIMDDYSLELQLAFINDRPSNGHLHAALLYEVENTSSADLRVDYTDFEGYADNYLVNQYAALTRLESTQEYNQLRGNLAPVKKLRGIVEFYVPEDFQVLESRYRDRDGNHVTHVINREQFEISK